MGENCWQPSKKTCQYRNISHRKWEKFFSMGEICCQFARNACPGRRFSHRNLKRYFSMGKLLRQLAENACIGRNFSHRFQENPFSVGNLTGQPRRKTSLLKRFSHITLEIHHPMGIPRCQPVSSLLSINSFLPIIPHKKNSIYSIAKKCDFLQKFRKKNKKSLKFSKNMLL